MPHIELKDSEGKTIPSVTQVIGILDKDWLWMWYWREVKKHGWRGWQKCKATSNRGMKFGTDVHMLVYNLLVFAHPELGLKQEPEIFLSKPSRHMEARKAAESIFNWLVDHEYTPLSLEEHLNDEQYGFHGTFDGVFEKDGKRYLVDFKTGSEISITYDLQMGGYILAHPESLDGALLVLFEKKSKKVKTKPLSKEHLIKCSRMFANLVEIYKFLRS